MKRLLVLMLALLLVAAPLGSLAEESLKIALSIPVSAAPYWTAVGYGVQKAVEELNAEAGDTAVTYQFFDPGTWELETQLRNIEDAITLAFDGMVIAPVDANGTVPAIEKAYAAGLPLFTVDLTANTDTILASYATSNYNAGITNAETMAELIKEKNGDYAGQVAMVMGRATISSHVARCQGFKDTMAEKYPNIEIVYEQFDEKVPEDTTEVAQTALVMYEKLDGIFATGDTAADIVCQVIDQADRFKPIGDPDHIVVVGFDGEKQGIENIRAGRQDATVAQNPVDMGYLAIKAMYSYLTDGTVPVTGDNNLIEVPHFAITTANVDSEEAAAFLWCEEVDKFQL